MEEKNTTLADILSWFRINITEGKPESYFEEYDVYATPEISRYGEYRLSDPCCLGEKMILEDDDEEQHPPKEIKQMGLELYCYGVDIYHVITNAAKSKPNMDDEELLYALNYFAISGNYVVYLKTDAEVMRSEKQWAKWEKGRHKDAVQTSENMQPPVSPNANRIVIDLLNYLGFPIEEECQKISRLLFIKHLKENGFQVEEGDDEDEVEEDAYYYYCEANEHYNNGQIEEAIQLFLKSLDMDYHFKTYEKLYWCYHSLHQYDLANYFIKRAYEENNNNDKVAYLYAKVLIDKKELDKAREILLSIIKRNPSYKKAEQEYLKIQE